MEVAVLDEQLRYSVNQDIREIDYKTIITRIFIAIYLSKRLFVFA